MTVHINQIYLILGGYYHNKHSLSPIHVKNAVTILSQSSLFCKRQRMMYTFAFTFKFSNVFSFVVSTMCYLLKLTGLNPQIDIIIDLGY